MPPDGRRAGSRRGAGFTLIELLVVLAIIGLAVGLVVPLLGRPSGATLGAAAGEVQAALRQARARAIEESRPVVFRGDTGAYWIGAQRHDLDAASGIRIVTLGGTQIAFFASGGSSGGEVVVQSAAARREIQVDAITGRADLVR